MNNLLLSPASPASPLNPVNPASPFNPIHHEVLEDRSYKDECLSDQGEVVTGPLFALCFIVVLASIALLWFVLSKLFNK